MSTTKQKITIYNIKKVIFDIEGTICPLSFVKETLYDYFLDKIPSILKQFKYPITRDNNDITALRQLPDFDYVKIFEALLQLDLEDEETALKLQSYDALLNHFQTLVKNDIKDKHLKQVQGLVWNAGYDSNEIQVSLFPDAIQFLNKLANSETHIGNIKQIFIYSSGSVNAQKLLLAHVKDLDNEQGGSVDLNPLVNGYFDINTSGHKIEKQSYTNIYESIKKKDEELEPKDLLFFSDNIHEVKAAEEAGLRSIIVEKPGNKPIPEAEKSGLTTIKSFDEIDF